MFQPNDRQKTPATASKQWALVVSSALSKYPGGKKDSLSRKQRCQASHEDIPYHWVRQSFAGCNAGTHGEQEFSQPHCDLILPSSTKNGIKSRVDDHN